MSDINALAPLPESEQDVTIGGLARFEAVHTFTLMREARRTARAAFGPNPAPGDMERHAEKVTETGAWFSVLLLLRALAEHAPEKADEVARTVWQFWNGRDDAVEFVADWLIEYGIDPAKVIGTERGSVQAKAERKTA